MKKIFALTVLFIFNVSGVKSQNLRKIHIGPQLGVNASVASKLSEGTEPLVFPSLGISLEYKLNEVSSIISGLAYTRVGESRTASISPISIHTKAHTDYLQVPIVVRAYTKTGKFFGQGGFQFGYGLSSKLLLNNNPVALSSDFNSIDFGLAIGAGYYITRNMCVDIRFFHRLDHVGKSDNIAYTASGPIDFGAVKLKILGIGLSYYF
jgi:hypothetical protein